MAGNRKNITNVKARQLIDTKGRPVIEVDIITENGIVGRAGASTGTSVGKNESFVLRDGDPLLFSGLSVFKAVENIDKIIAPAIIGMDVTDQEKIDRMLIELDGTKNKRRLGGNTIYAVSVAVARAAAKYFNQPMYQYMAIDKINHIYAPAINMINGGTYCGKTMAFQEFILIPHSVNSVFEGIRIGTEIFYKLGEIIKSYQKGNPPIMGNYYGYGSPSEDPFEVFDLLTEAAEQSGHKGKYFFSMDCASSEFYDAQEDAYLYRGKYISREELISLLIRLVDKYPIFFIEDVLQEDDFEGYSMANKKLNTIIIGDDFLCSSLDRTKKALKMGATQGIIIKPNQIGTLTEALETVKFMKKNNQLIVGSIRAGGVIDDPIAEISLAWGMPLLKTGAIRTGERTMLYNFALRVEEELNYEVKMFNIAELPCFGTLKKI